MNLKTPWSNNCKCCNSAIYTVDKVAMQKGSWGQDWGIYIMLATNDPRKKEVKIQGKRMWSKKSRLKRGLSSPSLFTMNTITISIGTWENAISNSWTT